MLGNTLVLEHNLFLGTLIKQPKLEPFTHFRTADPAACIRLGSMGLDVRGAGTKRDSERVREVERERKRERQIEKILSICVTKRNLKYFFSFFFGIFYCIFSCCCTIASVLQLLLLFFVVVVELTKPTSRKNTRNVLPKTVSQ